MTVGARSFPGRVRAIYRQVLVGPTVLLVLVPLPLYGCTVCVTPAEPLTMFESPL
jgi:hypothetical protein